MSDIYQHYMTLPKDNWTNINSFKQGYSDGAMRQCHPNLVGEPLFIYGIMGVGIQYLYYWKCPSQHENVLLNLQAVSPTKPLLSQLLFTTWSLATVQHAVGFLSLLNFWVCRTVIASFLHLRETLSIWRK